MALDAGDLDDLDRQIASVMDCNPLSEDEVIRLCDKTKEILQSDPNVPNVAAPVTVVGDIHGQFYDLLELFRIGGKVTPAPPHLPARSSRPRSGHSSAGPSENRGLGAPACQPNPVAAHALRCPSNRPHLPLRRDAVRRGGAHRPRRARAGA
jgi:hypothetical protein